MTNTFAIHNQLTSNYTMLAFTHNYVFTFAYCKVVYAVMLRDLDASDLMAITKVDKASRGGGYSLRFKPTNAQKVYLISQGAKVLCSQAYFNELVKSNKYNRGENAEMLVTEQLFGQEWEKDSVPFTEGGDIEAEGVAWQHKHEGGTFCTERSLHNLSK